MRKWSKICSYFVFIFLAVLSAKPSEAGSTYGGRIGSLTFSFDSIRGVSRSVRKAKKYYFYKKRCRVVGLYGRTRATFRRAVRFANRVVRSSAFSQVVAMKRRFNRSRHNGRQVLYYLLRKRTKVAINTFRRSRKFPCYTRSADGHTNAFARLRVPILFIYKPYLKREGRRGQLGVRNLAKTIVHETLHTIGYSHRGYKAWSRGYNNTVPPYIGCLIKHWPWRGRLNKRQRVGIARYCSLSSRQQSNRRIRRRFIPWIR